VVSGCASVLNRPGYNTDDEGRWETGYTTGDCRYNVSCFCAKDIVFIWITFAKEPQLVSVIFHQDTNGGRFLQPAIDQVAKCVRDRSSYLLWKVKFSSVSTLKGQWLILLDQVQSDEHTYIFRSPQSETGNPPCVIHLKVHSYVPHVEGAIFVRLF